MDDEDYDDDDGSEQVGSVLMKGLLVIVLIGVIIALGTTIVVRALGLNEGASSSGPVGSDSTEVTKPMPTTALPVPGEDEKSEDEFEEQVPPKAGKKGRIQLDVFPVMVRPNERINLTGTYPKADNVGLQVQRFEEGKWRDFGVSATVRVGTFETYVMTGQSGEQRFRMYDPSADEGSNVVLVTID
jgi:hypothetical protein